MDNGAETLRRRLAELRTQFVANLAARLEAIERITDAGERVGWTDAAIADLRIAAHSLKGSAGTYQLAGVSAAAARLENEMNRLAAVAAAARRDGGEARTLTIALRRAAADEDPAVGLRDMAAGAVTVDTGESADGDLRICLLEDDADAAAAMAQQLALYGYAVRNVHDAAALEAAVAERAPHAIVADVILGDDHLGGLKALGRINAERSRPIPAVAVSARSDIEARLEAVRAGARAYLPKPLEINELIRALEKLLPREESEPYRVLIVDDDADVADYHASILEAAGFETISVFDPLKTLAALVDYTPDLLLLDMYMPQCSGVELAEVVRQHPGYDSIPIVFLSAEQDVDRQLAAVSRGGDDFLAKPIRADRLISSVSARAARMRLLREHVTRDPMTRLLNHRATKERLEIEMARAEREKTPVSFALLDIDHFKKVNDTYGHPVGDSVIKSLARLLQQRMRKTDAVGRYGGEEFAVVLVGADIDTATRLLDDARERFAAMRQWSGETGFHATFSCGVVAHDGTRDMETLITMADEALYAAKRGGRNQVQRADAAEETT